MNLALSLFSAVLLILVFPRFDQAWLAPFALTPLLVALAREPRRGRHFLYGWLGGIVYWFGVCYWIRDVLVQFGGLPPLGGWACFLLFCAAKALHLGVFALLAGFLLRARWAAVSVPALWVAIERTHANLGFAWLALGNAGVDMSVPMRLAPCTGVYGLSFVFAMLACAVALLILRRPRLELAPLAALPCLLLLPAMPAPERGRETAALVQPDISETADWSRQWADDMHRRLYALTEQAAQGQHQQLVVWPEVPAPMYYFDDPAFRAQVDDMARRVNANLLLNVVAHTPAHAPLNSAVLVTPEGRPAARYDKVNLVPFGEFVPWPFKALVDKISTEAGDFAAGDRVVVAPVGSHRLGAFICYESVFPHFVRRFANEGAEVLVNISNDGWYGSSAARFQHLKIVRMRAAENRRWILRATNDGITSTIDPAGRLTINLPSYVIGAVRTGYKYVAERTVYTRFGDWFVIVCALVAAGFLGSAPLRSRLGQRPNAVTEARP